VSEPKDTASNVNDIRKELMRIDAPRK
jgi:hypothetical protein